MRLSILWIIISTGAFIATLYQLIFLHDPQAAATAMIAAGVFRILALVEHEYGD